MSDDLVSVPRSVARSALTDLMSEISEEHWAAGWLAGIEIILWKAMASRSADLRLDERQIDRLRILSTALGEWPDPNEGGGEWVPLSAMEKYA